MARFAVIAAALAALVVGAGCGSSSKTSTGTTTLPATQPATTPTTAAAVSSLSVSGVGPGVNETPFYPATSVTSVTCGTAPNGVFVEISLPAGGPPTPSSSALAQPTLVVVVPGNAVLKDHTGKVLYQMAMSGITTARTGSLVLSLNSITYIGGDRRSVVQGAVNVSGDYACPAGNSPFPGT